MDGWSMRGLSPPKLGNVPGNGAQAVARVGNEVGSLFPTHFAWDRIRHGTVVKRRASDSWSMDHQEQ
jgi:hypothetical protein